MSQPLHPSIISLISLAAGIAAKHPDLGLCELDRLRAMGVPEEHIQAAIEIGRHIRNEAAARIDAAFEARAHLNDDPAQHHRPPTGTPIAIPVVAGEPCCTPAPTGKPCC